jgi:hypothetical protein
MPAAVIVGALEVVEQDLAGRLASHHLYLYVAVLQEQLLKKYIHH